MLTLLALVLSCVVTAALHAEVGSEDVQCLLQHSVGSIRREHTELGEARDNENDKDDEDGEDAEHTEDDEHDKYGAISIKHYAGGDKGRWLFGSLTCPLDLLAVDQMLPHQLRQSASGVFDHKILYVSRAPQSSTAAQRSKHDEMLTQIRSKKLVDEMIDTADLNPLELAKRSMREDTARALVSPDNLWTARSKDYQAVMLSFLAKCLDGYDHCAWLDGDIFVHHGSVPWVNEAVLMSARNPQAVVSRGPVNPLGYLVEDFSSRYFVYHTQALKNLLPLDGNGDQTFEDVMKDNLGRQAQADLDGSDIAMYPNGGSWLIHPPLNAANTSLVLEACAPKGLTALIEIVEQGSESNDEKLYDLRDDVDLDVMDAQKWTSQMHQHCHNGGVVGSLLHYLDPR